MLVRPDRTIHVLEVSPGPPLGVGALPFEATTVDLEPGTVLALYTDGLNRHHDPDPDVGLRHLTDRLATLCRPDRPLEDTGRALPADAGEPSSRDDIALLLARTRALPAEAIAEWEFPADPAVVADAREVATRQPAAWGLDEAAFTTELVVSELVTNAVRYAGGPIGLRLLRDEVLICEVTDPSRRLRHHQRGRRSGADHARPVRRARDPRHLRHQVPPLLRDLPTPPAQASPHPRRVLLRSHKVRKLPEACRLRDEGVRYTAHAAW